jgi:hypothetical protein
VAPDPLRLEQVAVMLIDLAEGPLSTVRSIKPAELRTNAGVLAEICSLLAIPAILARAPLLGDAAKVLPEVTDHLSSPIEVSHDTNDSWETPAFVQAIAVSGRTQLAFAGIATDVGVALTALSAIRAGYSVAILADVCGVISDRAERAALCRLNQAGAIITTCGAFAGEVQRDYTKGKGPQVLRIVARSLVAGDQTST